MDLKVKTAFNRLGLEAVVYQPQYSKLKVEPLIYGVVVLRPNKLALVNLHYQVKVGI